MKIYQVLFSVALDNVDIYLRGGTFSNDTGIVNLHPSKGTHWVAYMNENYFDSYGCSPPQNLSELPIKQNGHCLFSEYKKQGLTSKRGSYCASYFLYISYLTKAAGRGFRSAVLN